MAEKSEFLKLVREIREAEDEANEILDSANKEIAKINKDRDERIAMLENAKMKEIEEEMLKVKKEKQKETNEKIAEIKRKADKEANSIKRKKLTEKKLEEIYNSFIDSLME